MYFFFHVAGEEIRAQSESKHHKDLSDGLTAMGWRGGAGREWVYTEMDTGKHTQRDKTTRPCTLDSVAASCMVVHEKVVRLNNF